MKKAKTLFLDIETAPKRALVWSMWKQNIGLNQLEADGYVLCWCAKWGDGTKVINGKLTKEEVANEDDSRIMAEIHELMDRADIIVGHNGDRFDIPILNARFVTHGLAPPSHYKTVDTLKIARDKFKFTSNRLDALGMFLKLGRKIETGGFQLWRDVMDGQPHAMKQMVEYCEQDVLLLEDVYLTLRPWYNKHPNVAMFTDGTKRVCNACGSETIHAKGDVVTNSKVYKRYKCVDCGHEMRAPYCEKDATRDATRMISI